MKNTRINYLSIAILFTALIACEKKNDNNATPQDVAKPEITDVHFHGAPGGRATAGATNFRVHFTVRDNVALREVKIDIHDNFDGHSHGKIKGAAFSWDTIILVSGTQLSSQVPVIIPADILAGPYHVGVFVTDAAGNQGDSKFTDLEITSSSQPILNITALGGISVPQAEYDMEPGDTLRITGTATDADGINEVHIEIEEEDHDHSAGRVSGGDDFFEKEFKPSTHASLFSNSNKSFDFSMISVADSPVMPNVAAGQHKDFELKVKVKDNLGNIIMRKFKLHVH